MINLFERTGSPWICYSAYEHKQAEDGNFYVTPRANAEPRVYDPLKSPETLVLDALNIGVLCMNRKPPEAILAAVMEFVEKYGLLGLMTALPTTPKFMDYESVYLPTNHFIRAESLPTEDYIAYFFPFVKPDVKKKGKESIWNLEGRNMIALSLTMQDKPEAVSMSFQRNYAERYDWMIQQFKDLAFGLYSSIFYYSDYDSLDEVTRSLYRQGMAAFGGITPTYHIELLDKPTIVWDFYSLSLCIQMMFSFMLTDKDSTLKICKHCQRPFIATRPTMAFCSPKCKNQYNVYKSRAKDKTE